jgi:hypothetical protein
MGGGSFDTNSYRSYTASVASKPREEVFTKREIDPDLDPKNIKVRESCDSADSPESTPIIIGVDVTGSMGVIAEKIAKGGLGTLFNGILTRKPVQYPHLMFMANGDAACDHYPLQVSQFEADNRIVDQLTKIFLEGNGGGNQTESYDLPWHFAAHHTKIDSMIKRGKRGYLFTIGDEMAPSILTRAGLEKTYGHPFEADVLSKISLEEAQRKYNVFHVIIEQGSFAARQVPAVQKSWKEVLGQHVISLSDYNLVAETIVSAIQVAEGTDHTTASSGWGHAATSVISSAVSSLPRGVPAPRQLGR